MAEEVFIKESVLFDIADAIREKNGRKDKYMPYQLSSAILELPSSKLSDLETYMRSGQILYSGYEGDCPWVITDHGTLVMGDPAKTTYLSEEYLSNPWSAYNTVVKNIIVNGRVVVPARMTNLFSGMSELWLIFNIGNLDTSLVESYQGWFQGCSSINTVDLSSWDASNVRVINWMFKNCSSLVEVRLPFIPNECEMIGTFSECGFVKFRFYGNKIIRSSNMSQTFYNCPNLVEANLSGIDISKIKYMESTFENCPNLTTVNIEPVFAPNLTSMKNMFKNCYALKKNPKNLFWKVPSLKNVSFMFHFCISLEEFEFDTPVFSIENISGMFSECYQLKKIDWTNWINFFYAGKETLHINSPFHNCWNLQEILTGSRTMLSTEGWQIAHYDAYSPRQDFQTVEGIKPSVTTYTTVNTMTSSSAFMGYNISGVPGYDLLNSVEAGLRIDWRMSYTEAVTQEVMDLTTGNMVQEGMYTNMNSQYTPAVNLPYDDYLQCKYMQAFMQDLYKLAVDNGMNKDAAASMLGLNENRNGYLKDIGLALPYYMVEQNTGIRTYQLNLNQPGIYIREDCVIEPEPYYKYPSMHNFLGQNFSKQFAGKVVKHIEWRTNVFFPLKNSVIVTVDDYGKKQYSNSLTWDYDHDTKTLIIATPENEFYIPADSSGMFSGMIYLEDFSFEKINTSYCCNYAYMFNGDSRLTTITNFKMNPIITREELIPFKDPCDESILEEVSEYRLVHRANDEKYYDWYYIYGIDTMFRDCSDLRSINFSEVDWGRMKTINRATKTYDSVLRQCLTKYIPTANEVILNKSYEKTEGYEQLSTDENWYRLPLNDDNEVIISKYDKNKISIIPNYNITVNGLIDGPSKYIRERAITQELLERTYGFDYNVFNSGMALRNMIENYLAIQGVSIQEIKSIDLRTRIVSPHGTQYITTLNNIIYEGPYLYYNSDTKKIIIQTKADNFIIKDNAEYTFYNMRELRRINGFNKIQWENITNISHLFDGCLSLFTIDLSNLILDTLTDTSYMFNNCELFDYLDLSHFNFSEVIDMEYMFNGCRNLIQLILPENIDTSKVTDMTHLFCNCEKLGLIDFKDFDTDKVTDMSYMFYNCKSLIYADLRNFNTLNVQDMSYMFTGCESLREMDISSIIFPRKKDYIFAGLPKEIYTTLSAQFNSENIYFNNLFEGCNFTQIDCSNFNWHMARDIKRMFKDCINLQSLSLGNVESPWLYSTYEMFANCESLTSITFDRWRTRGVTDISYMFYNCKSLVELDFAKIEFHGRLVKAASLFDGCESIPALDFSNCYLYCNFDRIFYNCKSLVSITGLHGQYAQPLGFSCHWRKTELVGKCFYNCQSLESLDLSYLFFTYLYDFSYLFYNCKNLQGLIDLQYSRSLKGTNFTGMFENCEKIEQISLPENITISLQRQKTRDYAQYTDTQIRFNKMFKNCYNLKEILNIQSIENWQARAYRSGENPTHWCLNETFYNCKSLKSLDIDKLISNGNKTDIYSGSTTWYATGWYRDTYIKEMHSTFYGCESLEYLHMPSDREMFFESYTIDMHDTFNGCKSLTDFYFENLHFNHRDKGYEKSYNNQNESDKYKYNFANLFKDCQKLTNIDLSTWWFNTYHNIAQTTGLPYNNTGNLGLSNEDIGNMSSMFENCYELEKIVWPKGTKSGGAAPTYDLVTWVFPFMYIKNADKMFKNCYKLTEIEQQCYPEIIFNTVVSAYQMMMNCKSIETNIVLLCSNYLRDMREIFSGCESMTYLDFRKHRTLFNYTEKENGLYNCLAMQQMDMGQFYDGRTRRFYLDIDNEGNYSLRIGLIAGARGDEYIYLPVTPGYDDPPNYRPYIGLDVAFWNELVQRAKSTYGKYIWIAVGGWANQNANSSIGSSTIRLLRDRPLYYSNWATYQGGWVVPSSGGIAYEWDRAPLMNIDDNAYIIQRKDNADVTTTIIWNLNINGFRIDNINDTTKNIIITSHNNIWSHTYGNNGYISSTDNYRPHFIWKSDRAVNYEIGQQVKIDLWNDNNETEYYLTLTNQMISFLNTDKDIYDYYFISAIGSSGSWGTDLWRFPRGLEFDYIEQSDGIKINFLNNIKNYYSGGGVWDGTRPVQWYALLETEKCSYINLNEWSLEEDIYPMQFPKDMYTGVQNMYTVWNGDIPIKVETYYDFPLLPEKYNSRLVPGSEFAYTIKRMANGANVTDGNYEDTKIKHIIFENGIQKTGTAIGSQGSPVVANWDNDTGTITITFEIEAPIILNANSSNMFYRLKGLQSIEGLDILDTSEVINASNMFKETGTSSLELDLRTWDMSNCTNMQNIFTYCTANLVNITNWDITSLTDIIDWSQNYVFFDHAKITTLNAENLDFSNITNLCCMFINATIPNLNIQNWNVSNIGNFRSIFDRLTTDILDINTWNTSSGIYMSYMFQYGTFNNIVFDQIDTSNVIDMQYMFAGCAIPEINISTWDISSVTTTYRMFYDTKIDLTTIALSNFNNEVCTTMSQMFQSCRATTIALSNFNNEVCINMHQMFQNCGAITITFSNFDIAACTTMYQIFHNTSNLQNLNIMNEWVFHANNDVRGMFHNSICVINNLERFNVSALINMHQMFYGYKGTELIFTNWDTSHCLYMSQMFAECTNLIILKIQTFDTSKVRNFEAMFYNCSKLETFETNSFVLNANDRRDYWYINSISGNYYLYNRYINSSIYRDWGSFGSGRTSVGEMFLNITIPLNISHWDVSNQIVFSTMFGGYKGTIVDLSEWNVQESTTDIIWRMMFNNCTNLQYAYLTSFWTENVSDIAAMFANCTSLIKAYFRENKIVLPEINTNTYGMYVGCTCDMHVEEWDLSRITTLNSLFRSYRGTTIDLSSWAGKLEHDQISGMNATFYDCNNLINLDLSGLANLDSVKDFGSCFAYMSNMITFDLIYLNTSSATSFYHMFYACPKLENLNFNNFVTDKVTNMEWMFAENVKLQELDLTTFNTFNVTNFRRMFYNCQALEELLIPNFNTSKWSGDNAERMFYNCYALKELYLPDTFTMINNTSAERMFQWCKSLQSIRIPETFGGENLNRVDGMFEGCEVLEELIFPDSFISPTCTNFQYMFQNCHSLRVLTQHFNMAGAYSTTCMMKNCYALEELNTYQSLTEAGWLFSDVMHCEEMFRGCQSLKTLDLSSVRFSQAGQGDSYSPWAGGRSLRYLFAECYALEELKINSLFIKGTGVLATNISYMFADCYSLKTLNISSAKFLSLGSNGAQYIFKGCHALESIDLKYSKFIGTTNMIGWFQDCYSLKRFDWNGLTFSTADKDFTPIIDMSYTFQGCKAIETVGFAENTTIANYEVDVNMTIWNVKNVTTTEGMFADCDNLITVDFAYSNFTKIQNSKTMFKNCISLESIVFPEDYNKNVNLGTYIYYDSMFEGCSSIDYIEFPNVIVANYQKHLQLPNMFKDCISLKTIEFRNAKQLYSYDNYANNCLSGCSSLENIYFSECDGWTGGNSLIRWICNGANSSGSFITLTVEGTINNNFVNFIRDACRIKYILLTDWTENDNGEITLHEANSPTSLESAFRNTAIDNLDNIKMNFSNVTNYQYLCCENNVEMMILNNSNWKNMQEGTSWYQAFYGCKAILINAIQFSINKVTNFDYGMANCTNLVTVQLPQFNMNINYILRYNSNLRNVEFINYNDTEKIRNIIGGMNNTSSVSININNFTGTRLAFNDYNRVTGFDIYNTNTSIITNLANCFNNTRIKSFDFDLLDVTNVTTMQAMFANNPNLTDIHFGEINTPYLTTIRQMFWYDRTITELNMSKWTFSTVTDLYGLFYYCDNLNTIDISGWDFSAVNSTSEIFRYATNLRTIYARGIFKNFNSDTNTYLSSTGVTSIYVPLSLLPKYKTAYQWKNVLGAFKNGSDKELAALQLTTEREILNCYELDSWRSQAQLTPIYIDQDNNIDVDPIYWGIENWSIESGPATVTENGLVILTSEAQEGDIVVVKAVCSYNNLIDTTIVLRIRYSESYFNINLNDNEWINSGTTKEGWIVYQSNKHTNQHNTTDTCKINIDGYETFILKYCSYGEPNYDYVIIKLDAQPTTSDYNYTTYGNSNMTYKTATFNNLEGIPHTIYISYRKDSSVNSNTDKGYFYIPEDQDL